jgi:peptide/nickel transport system substrate-binding protein
MLWSKLRATLVAAVTAGLMMVSLSDADAAPKGELRVASPFALTVMDLEGPQSTDRMVLTVNRHIYDALTWYNDKTGELEPHLATSWTATSEGWVFKLRENVKFHDGEPFTASDVRATVQKVLKVKGTISPILDGVEEARVIDDHTILFKTARPVGPLPNNLALLGIAPAKLLDNKDYHRKPVGTGPFKFVSFSPGQQLVLEANADYWKGPPGAEKLVFVDIPETTTRVTALDSGEIDLTWSFPATDYARLLQNDNLTIETVKSFLDYELLFNWNKPPLDNIKVREALAISINDEALFESLLGPLSSKSVGPLPPTVFGAAETGSWKYDPERAKQLLKEAGFGPGDIKLILLGRSQKDENDVGLAMISDWAKIGVEVQPRYMELAAWAKTYVAQDFQLSLLRRPTNTGDADWTLGRLYLSSSKRVPCANKELDQYILDGQASTDPAVRKEAYRKALTYIHDKLCGYYPRDVLEPYAWSKKVKGFVPSPATVPTFWNVTVDK